MNRTVDNIISVGLFQIAPIALSTDKYCSI